jgi:hypothetical protein
MVEARMVHRVVHAAGSAMASGDAGRFDMRMVLLAAGTPEEVQRALALAEELARRERLHVQRCVGATGSLFAGIDQAEVRFLSERPATEPITETHATVQVSRAQDEDQRGQAVLAAANDGTWFLFRGRYVDLSSRRVLSRVLSALLQARLLSPGRCLPPDELVRAAWPNEQMRRNSAANRLRVALSTLRRFGLREALCSRDGGVLIDTSVEILNVIEDGHAPQ